MRALILAAGSALVLTGCGNNGQSANTMNADENVAAESISSNDVTAIDAVTGDASNMAADVNYVEPPSAENETGNAPAHMPTPRTRTPGRLPLETPSPAMQAPTNNSDE